MIERQFVPFRDGDLLGLIVGFHPTLLNWSLSATRSDSSGSLYSMRTLLDSFNGSFDTVSSRTRAILDITPDELLYKRPRHLPQTFAMFTVGEYVLRSAAAVEQTFGGITTRLWDDPFEWTLPEKLHSVELISQYLDEVDKTRADGFAFLATDESLSKSVPAPTTIKPISQVLIETLTRSEHYLGRAYAVFQMLSDEKLPRVE